MSQLSVGHLTGAETEPSGLTHFDVTIEPHGYELMETI